MKFGINQFLVILAFSVLQAHNFIPHHHHHDIDSHSILIGHAEEGHHHHHFPIAHLHIDELFFAKIFQLQDGSAVAVVPDFHPFPEHRIPQISRQALGSVYLRDHPPSPPFLAAFSFRGPPVA